ncbi:unnamed protein product [Rhizophagus irregularis]|nr:unnamed protein product [Rhizophagus irregularis]
MRWVLELLQVPRVKEGLEEDRKKYFNLTAFKEWEEAGELLEEDKEALCMKTEQNEARHGANSQSVDCNTESKSVGFINRNVEVRLREFQDGKLRLDSPVQT